MLEEEEGLQGRCLILARRTSANRPSHIDENTASTRLRLPFHSFRYWNARTSCSRRPCLLAKVFRSRQVLASSFIHKTDNVLLSQSLLWRTIRGKEKEKGSEKREERDGRGGCYQLQYLNQVRRKGCRVLNNMIRGADHLSFLNQRGEGHSYQRRCN